MQEIAVALDQAEPARVLVAEGGDAQILRVEQRTPDPLALPGLHLETVAVVDLRPEIVEAAPPVLPEEEHAGQRRHAELADVAARIDRSRHFGLRIGAGVSTKR